MSVMSAAKANPSQSSSTAAAARGVARVHRFEVRPHTAVGDPLGESVRRDAGHIGLRPHAVHTARVYLVRADLAAAQIARIRSELLANEVLEACHDGASPVRPGDQLVEVLPLPGVMDPAALTVEDAIRELTGVRDVQVSTGVRYDITGLTSDEADRLARRQLANPAIQAVHRTPYHPTDFPHAHAADQTVRHVQITTLCDDELNRLSRDGHLFLSLEEMKAIQAEYRRLGREPRDIELETLAQTWSEHCVHKTLKSTITYRDTGPSTITWAGRPGHVVNPDGSVTIHNLLKSTVAAATFELIQEGVDWTLSVFKDNSGVIRFDDQTAVCIKVETHNHPSAIEPYGGAATGVGGCIRDVIGTGLGAKPIANTDVFCVAMPDMKPEDVPSGCLHPRRVLTRVIDGVRDYGNRMGIPTVNGAVFFDDRYIGNPLVFCGCIGVMPTWAIKGKVHAGDRIVALGGRTGRDGIHGATFSSAELTDTHADEFSHAVQIGNAITEKRTLDAILRARGTTPAECLYHGLTDCGAGGFSSAVGEMGAELGAEVHLDRAPLKYDGLRYDEIWISESQERMVLAVPPDNMEKLRQICTEEGVELADLGHFGTPGSELVLHFKGQEVGRLPMHFLHEGIPMPVREAVWTRPVPPKGQAQSPPPLGRGPGGGTPVAHKSGGGTPPAPNRGERSAPTDIKSTLLALLAHPNIASKRWIVRQYDHEVQGNTIIKPLVGPGGIGPGDASVIKPVPGSQQGLAIACGLQVPVGDPQAGGDPYQMALAAVDECVRNLVCVGADPERIAILDNFCWPSCGKPENLASLVRAAEGCYDAAKAYRTPFVSGKDSLNNQFRTEDGRLIEIPPTLLITGIGVVPDVSKCVTMDLKRPGSALALITAANPTPMIGSHYEKLCGLPDVRDDQGQSVRTTPAVDPDLGAEVARSVHRLVNAGVVAAAHDISEGGLLVALAEMAIASGDRALGASIGFETGFPDIADLFGEPPHSYLVELNLGDADEDMDRVIDLAETEGIVVHFIGEVTDEPIVDILTSSGEELSIPISDLRRAFLGTLDW